MSELNRPSPSRSDLTSDASPAAADTTPQPPEHTVAQTRQQEHAPALPTHAQQQAEQPPAVDPVMAVRQANLEAVAAEIHQMRQEVQSVMKLIQVRG